MSEKIIALLITAGFVTVFILWTTLIYRLMHSPFHAAKRKMNKKLTGTDAKKQMHNSNALFALTLGVTTAAIPAVRHAVDASAIGRSAISRGMEPELAVVTDLPGGARYRPADLRDKYATELPATINDVGQRTDRSRVRITTPFSRVG